MIVVEPYYFVTVKRVRRIGKSLSFILPSVMSRFLRIFGGRIFYVYIDDGGRLVYSLGQPRDRKAVKIKPRVQARHGDHEYYAITVPAEYSYDADIREGSKVVIKCGIDGLVVEKLEEGKKVGK